MMAGEQSPVEACPECDSSKISRRVHKPAGNPSDDKRYRCLEPECGHTFDDPKQRERKTPGGGWNADTVLEKLKERNRGDA